MNAAVAAFSLLSRIPVGGRETTPSALRGTVSHFPLVGYAAGASYVVLALALGRVFHDRLIAVIGALAVVYYFFNLFHFDGFMDTVDGMLSQKPKERVLEIMRSGTVGPSAVLFGLLYLLLKLYLLAHAGLPAVLAAFVLARWGMSFACTESGPARTDGLALPVLGAGKKHFLFASIYAAALLFVVPVVLLAVSVLFVIGIDAALVRLFRSKIGGLTGDTLGCINEVNEVLVLLAGYVLAQHPAILTFGWMR